MTPNAQAGAGRDRPLPRGAGLRAVDAVRLHAASGDGHEGRVGRQHVAVGLALKDVEQRWERQAARPKALEALHEGGG